MGAAAELPRFEPSSAKLLGNWIMRHQFRTVHSRLLRQPAGSPQIYDIRYNRVCGDLVRFLTEHHGGESQATPPAEKGINRHQRIDPALDGSPPAYAAHFVT